MAKIPVPKEVFELIMAALARKASISTDRNAPAWTSFYTDNLDRWIAYSAPMVHSG
jgi:hypothetical protein